MDKDGAEGGRRSASAIGSSHSESAIAAAPPSPSGDLHEDFGLHNVRYGGGAPGSFTSAATEASYVDAPSGCTPANSTRGGTANGSPRQSAPTDAAAAAAAADVLSTLDRRSTNSLAASLAPSHGWSTTATVARPRSVVSEPLDGITEGSASSDVGGGAASTADGGPPSPCYASGSVAAHALAQPPSPQLATPRLPPRLVVFQPDGLFDIGIDPRRRHLLKPSRAALSASSAAEAAALRQRQAAAALAQAEEEGEAMLAGWQRAYGRQKVLLLVCLLIDLAYLVALAIVRCVWSNNGSGEVQAASTCTSLFWVLACPCPALMQQL